MKTDLRIAVAGIIAYFALTLLLLPVSEYPRAIGGAALVFGIVAVVARRLGRGPVPGLSVFGVACAAGAVLVMPTLPAMGGTVMRAIPLGFFGMQLAALLWAVLRWRPRRPAGKRVRLVATLVGGAAAAVSLSILATIGIVLGLLRGFEAVPALAFVYVAYFVGALAAAIVYWLLQSIAHLATGRYLIGALGGICFYGAIAPVVSMMEEKPMGLWMMLVVAAIAGGLVGPALALEYEGDESEAGAPAV
jgi:hypothetical protein